ncbi:hypothetical protein ACFL27_11645 [candidate division CSSED10-310 bacterium]|uniref:DUF2939 domain-containing protein n=1 Tax=candidate division CSSED10-310 bacterium TaxID=2855610 RepID=A0ABV6YXC6_UNCC1
MKKKYIIIGSMCVVGLILFLIMRKNALEKFMFQGIQAVEQEKRDTLLDMISQNYIDQLGLTRENTAEILKRLFENFNEIKVISPKIETQFKSKQLGTVEMEFKVVASIAPGAKVFQGMENPYGNQRYFLVGTPMKAGHISLELVQENHGWKLKSIQKIDVGYSIPTYAQEQQKTEQD